MAAQTPTIDEVQSCSLRFRKTWPCKGPRGSAEAARAVVAFLENPEATELCLHGFELTALPESIGRLGVLGRLKKFDCSGNWLTELPDSLGDLVDLVSLECENNQLEHIPESVSECMNLKKLNCSHNRLTTLPFALGRCQNLERLICTFNSFDKSGEPWEALNAAEHSEWGSPQLQQPILTYLRTEAELSLRRVKAAKP